MRISQASNQIYQYLKSSIHDEMTKLLTVQVFIVQKNQNYHKSLSIANDPGTTFLHPTQNYRCFCPEAYSQWTHHPRPFCSSDLNLQACTRQGLQAVCCHLNQPSTQQCNELYDTPGVQVCCQVQLRWDGQGQRMDEPRWYQKTVSSPSSILTQTDWHAEQEIPEEDHKAWTKVKANQDNNETKDSNLDMWKWKRGSTKGNRACYWYLHHKRKWTLYRRYKY